MARISHTEFLEQPQIEWAFLLFKEIQALIIVGLAVILIILHIDSVFRFNFTREQGR